MGRCELKKFLLRNETVSARRKGTDLTRNALIAAGVRKRFRARHDCTHATEKANFSLKPAERLELDRQFVS